MRRLLPLLLCLCSVGGVSAQERSLFDSLQYRAEMQGTLAGGDHSPLWLNANKYGLSSLKKANGYIRGAIMRPLSNDDGRRWGVGYGVDLALAAGFTSTLVIQQAYIEARWLKGVLTVGAKEQPMELKNQELSSGSQTLGINARPVPQVRIALPDYWSIPGTRNWLALKGHIAYGKTTDDGWQKDFKAPNTRYTENTLYHSKAGYLRIGPKNITFEFGLEMASQFGGKSYVEITPGNWGWVSNESGFKSFWHAFIPGGGESDETTYRNASGNILGSWVARFNYDAKNWAISAYIDHYFEDHSSMFMLDYDGYGEGEEWNTRKKNKYLLYDFKDMLLGLELKLKQNDWLNNIVLEYIYTKYQSGPVYHDRTKAFSDHIGGNDNYYNHHIFTGWQHWGQVMGNPLYLSPLYNDNGRIYVANNRFVAWHLGIGGKPVSSLSYRFLATYQTGLGTYDDPYTSPQYDLSLLAEVSWRIKGGWSLSGGFGMDKGKLRGDNYGVQLTLVKSGIIRK